MADLAVQLGYERTEQQVQRRLKKMQGSWLYAIYVAEPLGCHLVGWIAAYIFRAVELDPDRVLDTKAGEYQVTTF